MTMIETLHSRSGKPIGLKMSGKPEDASRVDDGRRPPRAPAIEL
jgi:hypothetical protein